jgi:hypothetical protein
MLFWLEIEGVNEAAFPEYLSGLPGRAQIAKLFSDPETVEYLKRMLRPCDRPAAFANINVLIEKLRRDAVMVQIERCG